MQAAMFIILHAALVSSVLTTSVQAITRGVETTDEEILYDRAQNDMFRKLRRMPDVQWITTKVTTLCVHIPDANVLAIIILQKNQLIYYVFTWDTI